MDRVADVQAFQIDGDMIGDVTRRHDQLDLGAHRHQSATALEAGAFVVVDEVHVDEQVHLGRAAQAHEVDVDRQILDDILLHAAADDAHVFLAFNLKVEQRGHEATGAQLRQQLVEVELHVDRVFAVAIDDSGYLTVAASLAGGPLA